MIINKNWKQHLADDYSETEDVVHIQIIPEAAEQHLERLCYDIMSQNKDTGAIVMTWESLKLALPVSL